MTVEILPTDYDYFFLILLLYFSTGILDSIISAKIFHSDPLSHPISIGKFNLL